MLRRAFLTTGIGVVSALIMEQQAEAGWRRNRRKQCYSSRPRGVPADGPPRDGFHTWTIDIVGKQIWRLLYADRSAFNIGLGQSFIVEALVETNYTVTDGRGPITGAGAWLGYGEHHASNQVPSLFDGALYFHTPHQSAAGCVYGNNSGTNPITFPQRGGCYGQLYACINDGGPQNNTGKLRFRIRLY